MIPTPSPPHTHIHIHKTTNSTEPRERANAADETSPPPPLPLSAHSMEDDTNVTHRRHNPQSNPQTRRRKTQIMAAANGHPIIAASSPPRSSPPRSSPSSSPFTKSPSYVSLKDLIPSASPISSPPTAAAASSILTDSTISDSGEKISIRNRLLKQAASAYLRPMSTSSADDRRLWWWWWLFAGEVLEPVRVNVRRLFDDAVSRVCSWLTDAFWFLLRWLPR
ncbi:hypothetical protein Droror1_Dr00013794 [Drosera rotundifolia]